MSCWKFFADTHLNLFYQLGTKLNAGCHLQKQYDSLIAAVMTLLRHTKAVLNLLETFHYNHVHRVSVTVTEAYVLFPVLEDRSGSKSVCFPVSIYRLKQACFQLAMKWFSRPQQFEICWQHATTFRKAEHWEGFNRKKFQRSKSFIGKNFGVNNFVSLNYLNCNDLNWNLSIFMGMKDMRFLPPMIYLLTDSYNSQGRNDRDGTDRHGRFQCCQNELHQDSKCHH